MNCPTADKLSQFEDQLLSRQEMAEIEVHIQSCISCGKVVHAFREEQRFIEETLKTPTLPENFTDYVLDQLEPYGKPKKRRPAIWKRIALTAAGIALAIGIVATVNPAFAQFIGGLFSTDQVDDGLKIAADAGLVDRVDFQVEDRGLTFVVEDIIADSSRVSLSYKVLNKNGKPQDTYINISESRNEISAFDQSGQLIEGLSAGWQEGSDYGFIEFSLREEDNVESLTIHFNLVELNGVKGNWQLDVPVDLQAKRKLTKLVDLRDASAAYHGVEIDMKKLQIAPSSMELFFETSLTKEEQKKLMEAKRKHGEEFGESIWDNLIFGNSSSIEYHIENGEGKVLYTTARDTHSDTAGMLQNSGSDISATDGTAWIHSFVPKNENQLTFVLDGVHKKEPTDISLTFKPKDIKKEPVSIDYEGVHLTIKSVKKPLFSKEPSVVIKMEGGTDSVDTDLGNWIAVDGKGNSYTANFSSSILDKKDENGRHIATMDLQLDGLEKVPEELTLYLVTKTNYYPVEEQWKVPLLGE